MHSAPFLLGLSVGTVLVIVVVLYSRSALHKSVEAAAKQAKREGQIELARVTERSNSQTTRIQALEKQVEDAAAENKQLQAELTQSREDLARAQSTVSIQAGQLTNLGEEVLSLTGKRDDLSASNAKLQAQIAELTTTLKSEADKISFLIAAKEELTNSFKSLASDILEEKSLRFTLLNKENIAQILDPLKTKILEFQTQVQSAYTQESNGRAALGQQVMQLMERSQQVSEEANNLAKALTGRSRRVDF
jgi:DNA recombination protein RmuC